MSCFCFFIGIRRVVFWPTLIKRRLYGLICHCVSPTQLLLLLQFWVLGFFLTCRLWKIELSIDKAIPAIPPFSLPIWIKWFVMWLVLYVRKRTSCLSQYWCRSLNYSCKALLINWFGLKCLKSYGGWSSFFNSRVKGQFSELSLSYIGRTLAKFPLTSKELGSAPLLGILKFSRIWTCLHLRCWDWQ